MKNLLITIAAVLLVGCGESKISTRPETSKDDFINRFYAKHNIEEEYQISFEDLVEISKGEDDRCKIKRQRTLTCKENPYAR